jgi:PucR C-terminal helix-turn-helix domain
MLRESGNRELADLLRPETARLANEICAEIPRIIPMARGRLAPAVRYFVEQALATFVDRIADPSAPADRLAELCRLLGRTEAYHGRSLNALHAALRAAFRVAWHRTTEVCARHELPAGVVAELAEAQLEYLDELASICVEGYLEARTQTNEELAELRRRLLRLILERPAAPPRVLAELAERADWTIPAEVTLVVTRKATRVLRTALADDVLADLDDAPRLLFPGELDQDRRAMLEAAIPRDPIVVGVTVPLAEAADSLRWATRAFALVADGVIDGGRVTLCEDHLLTLWLMADPGLLDELARQRLSWLADVSESKRKALTETLRVWLESWSTAAEVGGRLHVHPQTVRYRLNQLKESLGERLTDPEARFGLELVLRARRLRDRTEEITKAS